MNYEGDCRTAPATPGLLIMPKWYEGHVAYSYEGLYAARNCVLIAG